MTNKDVFRKSVVRRMTKIMKSCLSEVEKNCPNVTRLPGWNIARFNILTIGNDCIRATQSEFDDYVVHTRPISIDRNHSDILVFLERNGCKLIDSLELGKWYVKFISNSDESKIINELRSQIGVGVVFKSDEEYVYYIRGVDDLINFVVPVFDKLLFKTSVYNKYVDWRKDLVKFYIHGDR